MKQLKQSQFIKNGIEHENVSSPETSVDATRVVSISIDKYGKFQYTTDGTNYVELDPQASEISSVDTIYDDVSQLPESQQYGTILPAYTNTALPVILYEYTEDDGWVEKALVNEYSIYYVADKGTLYVFIGTEFVSTTPEQVIKKITIPETLYVTEDEIITLSTNNCVLEADIITTGGTLPAGTILTQALDIGGGSGNAYAGMYITNFKVGSYTITYTSGINKKIFSIDSKVLRLQGIGQINGKSIPNYPSNTGLFYLQIEDGVLLWKADNSANYVTLDGNQTITGTKTFTQGIDLGDNATITKDSSNRVNLNYGNSAKVKVGSAETIIANRIGADSDNSQDIGRDTVRWKDLYLAGNITDGTNSTAVSDIASKSNVALNYVSVNAQELTSTQQTQARTNIDAEKSFSKNTAFNKNFETTATNIKMNGTQSLGSLDTIARADHVHPSDTTKQNVIDANNMLSADLVDDTNTTNKFVTSTDITAWNGKQNALSQTQLDAVNSGADATKIGQIATNTSNISTINGKIPSSATSSNQLADKAFVNSSINALTAYYITKNSSGDPFATKLELTNATTFYSGGVARVPTTNDYCIVLADESKQSSTGVDPTTRYSYQGGTYPNGQWDYQYTINDTPLTSAQLNAINSGITSSLVTQIGTNQSDISSLSSNKQDKIDSTHKLSADLVDDTSTTNKFVTASDKTTWDGKQNALPTTTTAGKVLKSTTTAGTLEWADDNNTTYSSLSASQDGTDVSLVTTGEKYIWNNKQSALPTTNIAGKVLTSTSTSGSVQWNELPENTPTDVKINGTSITSSGVANIVTNSAYNASTNKIATMNDLPNIEDAVKDKATKHAITNTKIPEIWKAKTWNFEGTAINIDGENVWTWNGVIYYNDGTNSLVYDVITNTWKTKTWTYSGNVVASNIVGADIIYMYANPMILLKTNTSNPTYYSIDIANSTIAGNGYNLGGTNQPIRTTEIWTDGENWYSSGYKGWGVFSNGSWTSKTWTTDTNVNLAYFQTSFKGENIWTDGANIYISKNANQFVLNKAEGKWYNKTWSGVTSFNATDIWTDGEKIFLSSGSNDYILNNDTWEAYTQTGKPSSNITSWSGKKMWTDGQNIYVNYEENSTGISYVLANIKSSKPALSTSLKSDPNNIQLFGNAIQSLASSISGKANDNAVVHLAGSETITGEKTFSGNIKNTGTYYIGSGNVVLASMSGSDLTLGNSSSALKLAGSGTRPTYNGNSLALQSDVPSIPTTTTANRLLTSTSTSGTTQWQSKSNLRICSATSTSGQGLELWTDFVTGLYQTDSGAELYYSQDPSLYIDLDINSLLYVKVETSYTYCDIFGTDGKVLHIKYNNSTTEGELISYTYYPIGAIYMSVDQTSPASLFGGTWSEISAGKALWTTATSSNDAGGTINASLPNITGFLGYGASQNYYEGAIYKKGSSKSQLRFGSTGSGTDGYFFDASKSNSIYNSNTTTVQPPAYKVYAWKRIG